MSLNRPCVDWAGQRIWVIGASSGIGAALSRRLVELGARVAVSSRNGAALAALGACHVEVVDITDRAALRHAFDAVRTALAEIDLVV
ncbi:MAG TPA: SDR family NAD(P)-dependent oxidoreductase, partial [Pseudomonadales bacterium]|nr:SDR family NAD(P)-dependent oxidoreductase [Pseudomonadales bacterium]